MLERTPTAVLTALIAAISLLGCPKEAQFAATSLDTPNAGADTSGGAPIPAHLTLGFPGPLEFQRQLVTIDDQFNASVYYPISDEPVVDAPLIVFNVGWNAIRNTYESYCIQLAQWGYVCVIRYYPSLGLAGLGADLFDEHVAHCLRVIDWAEEQNQNPESPIYGMVDSNNVGLIGHSFGGSVTLVAMSQDDRIRTAISLDALFDGEENDRAYDFETRSIPLLYIGGTAKSLCGQPPGADFDLYAEAQRPKQRVMIVGADHMDFMEPSPNSPDSQDVGDTFCQTGTLPAVEARVLAHRYMIAWLNYHLQENAEFWDYFAGALAYSEANDGVVEIDISI